MKNGQMVYQGEWGHDKGDLEEFYLSRFGDEKKEVPVL